MKIALLILGSLAALVAVVVIVGSLLPKAHTASRSAVVAKTPDAVYAYAHRRATDDRQYEIVEEQPPRRLVTRVADKTLPYGGSWTIDLAPEGNGTRITITENGEVYNPVFRFVSRFVIGHTATIDKYLADLAAAHQ
jgi:hypothetical protein